MRVDLSQIKDHVAVPLCTANMRSWCISPTASSRSASLDQQKHRHEIPDAVEAWHLLKHMLRKEDRAQLSCPTRGSLTAREDRHFIVHRLFEVTRFALTRVSMKCSDTEQGLRLTAGSKKRLWLQTASRLNCALSCALLSVRLLDSVWTSLKLDGELPCPVVCACLWIACKIDGASCTDLRKLMEV